jgi:hypothetical protein
MKNWSKLAMSAGAIGVIGVAGSFGTFSAFTAANPSHAVNVASGTIEVSNDFQLPDLSNLGTRDTTWSCNGDTGVAAGTSECFGGVGEDASKSAGSIVVENTGSLPQDVYVDFDGVGKTGVASPNLESGDVLADNIIIDSSTNAHFDTRIDAGTRLWVINRAGPRKFLTLQPGESQRIYFRAHLRERSSVNPDGSPVYPDGDNAMQGQHLSIPEKVTVSAVEVGRDDLLAPVIQPGQQQGYNGGSAADVGKRYDYGV